MRKGGGERKAGEEEEVHQMIRGRVMLRLSDRFFVGPLPPRAGFHCHSAIFPFLVSGAGFFVSAGQSRAGWGVSGGSRGSWWEWWVVE